MNKNTLVLYKSQPAVVTDRDGDKYLIRFCTQPATAGGKKAVYGEQKVREKDVVLLHEGPASSLEAVLAFSDDKLAAQLEETHELLLSDSSTATEAISLADLCEYARGSFNADEAWAFYSATLSSVFFASDSEALKNGKIQFIPRSAEEIEALNKKQYEKNAYNDYMQELIKSVKENS